MFIYFLKEIRQLCRNLVFWGSLLLQVALSLLVIYLRYRYNAGDDLFSYYYRSIGILFSFVIAINLSMHWNEEKNDDALNPFVTTPLPPVQVVAEKYLATGITVLLPLAITQIFLACTAPAELREFLFSYLFPTDAAALLLSAALILVCASVSGKNSTVGTVLPGILLLIIVTSAKDPDTSFALFSMGVKSAASTVLYLLMPLILVFALTVAAVSAPSSDRAVPVRIALLLTLAAEMIVFCADYPEAAAEYKAAGAAIICWSGAFMAVIAAVAERGEQSRRIAAEIRRLPAGMRILRALCSTGAVTEVLFSFLLAAAAAILTVIGDRHHKWDSLIVFLLPYTIFLFSAAIPLLVASTVKRQWNKKLHPVLLYIIAIAILFFLFYTTTTLLNGSADELKTANILTVFLGVTSLLMLVPTATDFVTSLKRR